MIFFVCSVFRLLEEALFEGHWIICLAPDNSTEWANYLRFVLEKCIIAKNGHPTFRVWIICKAVQLFKELTTLIDASHCLVFDELAPVRSITLSNLIQKQH